MAVKVDPKMATPTCVLMCCCATVLLSDCAVHRETVTAQLGNSAILPCRAPDNNTIIVVEWTREDMKTEYILLYRDLQYDPTNQHQSFKNRVELLDKQMKDGQMSLVLKNVRTEDFGTYECRVLMRGTNRIKRSTGLDSEPISIIILNIDSSVSQHALEVEEGEESVQLPCKFPTSEMKNCSVEWSRPDLNPTTVHLHRVEGDYLQNQNQNYRGRTFMVITALEDGDLGLTVTKPNLHDTGKYVCNVFYFGHKLRRFEVQLEVHRMGVPTWITVFLVLLSLLLLFGAIIGGVHWYRRLSDTKDPELVEVDSGAESVLLPCKTKTHLPADFRVEWTDGSADKNKVHVYQYGSDHPEEQHRYYRGRTEMKDNLETGDFSLTLKYPTTVDKYIYTCTIYSSEGNMLMKKQVELGVKECYMEVGEGAESVLLSFKTTPDLPGDTKVEWWHDELGMMVYRHRSNCEVPEEQHQFYSGRTEVKVDLSSGVVSLTLKDLTERDSGCYGCRVTSVERRIRRMTKVVLKIKGTVQDQDHPEDIRNGRNSTDPTPLLVDTQV
ncbi:butyrophilin-like protein 2 [Pholidichthys leucotaenia]